jgi:hypothetical protein
MPSSPSTDQPESSSKSINPMISLCVTRPGLATEHQMTSATGWSGIHSEPVNKLDCMPKVDQGKR